MRWMLIATYLSSAIIPLSAAPPPRPYTVENYDVSIQADLAKQLLHGEVTIRLHSQVDSPISVLEMDAGKLGITSVMEGDIPRSFDQDHALVFIALPSPMRGDKAHSITIRFQAGPAPGLKFSMDQIYTTSVSDWMPCNNRPGERATLHLTLTAPSDNKTAASGQLTATRAGEGQTVTEWQVNSPTDPSLFGFALGSFSENLGDAEGVKLRVLGAGAEVLTPTGAAMQYIAERSGKHYPGQTYTQVFVHGDATRSMAEGLTLLPDSYAQALAKQPGNLRPLAEELAQQWYGFAISPRNSSDLWLAAGISTFVADAFLGERFGKARYESEIAGAGKIYKQLSAEGKDQPLSEANGETARDKGAWFLYLVNQLIGDSAFWNGLRLYTNDKWNQTAASDDLQRAFDAVNTGSGSRQRRASKNRPSELDNLFDLWVHGVANTPARRSRGHGAN